MTHRHCRHRSEHGEASMFHRMRTRTADAVFRQPGPAANETRNSRHGSNLGFFGHSIASWLTGANMAGFIYSQKIKAMSQSKGGTEMEKRLQATIVRLPDDLHSEMRIAAIRRRTTLQKVMVEAVARWLQEIKEVNSEKEKTA